VQPKKWLTVRIVDSGNQKLLGGGLYSTPVTFFVKEEKQI
jgi:hypothetical protein